MKELIKEDKARLFAQYFGQMVGRCNSGGGSLTSVTYHLLGLGNPERFHLELTPLSQITDEDAIEVARLLGSDFKIEGGLYSVSITIQSVKEALIEAINIGTMNLPVHVIDYLRSKGYALPYLGLSVDEMVSAGWIKLSEKGGKTDE